MIKEIKKFTKNKFQEIRVSITEYQGNDLIDIRTWTMPKGAEEMVPTGKGVSINVKLYPELKEAVLMMEKELKDNNLLEG
ncbi:transcriptional coactivator p15/PC4 family protein [Candidatus Omnitrophota bacterium]